MHFIIHMILIIFFYCSLFIIILKVLIPILFPPFHTIQDVFNISPAPNRSTVTEEEVALKKQLEESQQVIHELQNKIQRLAIENTELKSRIKSQAGEEDEIVDL